MNLNSSLITIWNKIKELKEAVFNTISTETTNRTDAISNLQTQIDNVRIIDLSDFENHIIDNPITID